MWITPLYGCYFTKLPTLKYTWAAIGNQEGGGVLGLGCGLGVIGTLDLEREHLVEVEFMAPFLHLLQLTFITSHSRN